MGKLNRLDHDRYFRLCEAVRANAERFKSTRPSYSDAADILGQALGFPVNASQVKQAAEQVSHLWESPQSKRKVGSAAARLMALEAECVVLRGMVLHLYAKLGEKPPPSIVPAAVAK